MTYNNSHDNIAGEAPTIKRDPADNPYEDRIALHTLKVSDGRQVAFATSGDPNGTPVLFFYAGGGNRRVLLSLHPAAVSASLKLICLNRPGKDGTSKATTRGAASHVKTVCDDCICVLDALGIDKVSLLFMCAGSPFALAFSNKNPERMTGKLVGIACFVSPADCPMTKSLYRFGARCCPNWAVSPLVASSMNSMMHVFTWLSPSGLTEHFKNKVLASDEEREAFEKANAGNGFSENMGWVFEERGGLSSDLSVLLSKYEDVGIELKEVYGKALLFHPIKDKLTPIEAAEWLSEHLRSATLTKLPEASHEGTLFLLHDEIVQSLKTLA